MIVKDEAQVIERCLDSVKGIIDTWVIVDTGSKDGTPDIIWNALKGIPGALYKRQWHNFGENRTELMELARGMAKADYLLLLDADMTITVSNDTVWENYPGASSYMLYHEGELGYWVTRLVKNDRKWWYVGVTHEYIKGEHTENEINRLDNIVIHHHADGGTRSEKFERDVILLHKEYKKDPTNTRTIFYLAQTYRDQGNDSRAIYLYKKRVELGGWDEEVFYSLYQIGVLSTNWTSKFTNLIKAWEYRPSRAEPLYSLATELRQRAEYNTAFLFADRGVWMKQPSDLLFMSSWIYDWGLLFEYSICAYYVGEYDKGLAACDKLLRTSSLPDNIRTQTEHNREFYN